MEAILLEKCRASLIGKHERTEFEYINGLFIANLLIIVSARDAEHAETVAKEICDGKVKMEGFAANILETARERSKGNSAVLSDYEVFNEANRYFGVEGNAAEIEKAARITAAEYTDAGGAFICKDIEQYNERHKKPALSLDFDDMFGG